MDPRIADYIRANRKKFPRRAITDQLVQAGHDRAAVEQAWIGFEMPEPDAVAGPGFWGRFAIIVIVINLGVLLLIGLLSGALQSGGIISLMALAIPLGIGALIAWGIVALTGPANLGRTTAMVIGITIPLFTALFIGGAGFAFLGAMGGSMSGSEGNGTMSLDLGPPIEQTGDIPAMCFANGPNGWSVYANWAFENGGFMDVSIDSFPAEPGVPSQPSVNITALNAGQSEFPFSWSSDAGVGAIVLNADATGQSGTVTLNGLPSTNGDPKGFNESLSGEISWACG